MPVQVNVNVSKFDDGLITVNLEPQAPVGGWDIRFESTARFGGSTVLITKSVASGYNGASGITITSSGQGQFNVTIAAADTSGLDYGAYAYTVAAYQSGGRKLLTAGYMVVNPSVPG